MDAEAYSRQASDGLSAAQVLELRLVGRNQRVLEFGCAAGHVTRYLAEQGCSVVGLEIDPHAAELAAEHAEEVVVLDLARDDFATKLAGREFDVALFGDVLEHLPDPLSVLRPVRRLLAPGTGFVVVSVPNVAHVDVRLALLDGEFEYGPLGLLDQTHLRFFTLASLERLIDDAGLVPLEVHRMHWPAFGSEIGIDRDRVEPAVLARVLADPDAETYQFVVKAVPFDGAYAVGDLARRVRRVEDELRISRIDRAVEVTDLERRAEQAEEAAREADARAGLATEDARSARERATRSDAELNALLQTKLVRWSAPLRRLYHSLRRRR